jgi:hypothetical protein
LSDSLRAQYPTPPNLHWAVLLAVLLGLAVIDEAIHAKLPWRTSVDLMSIGMFAWEIRQAVFVREIDRGSSGVWMTAVGVAFGLVGMMTSRLWLPHSPSWIFGLLGFVFVLGAQFNMRRSLELHYDSVEPIGLKMNPVLLFILGVFYLQYHFHRIAALKRTMA